MIESLVTNNHLALPGFKTSQTLSVCLLLSIYRILTTLIMTAAATLELLVQGYYSGL